VYNVEGLLASTEQRFDGEVYETTFTYDDAYRTTTVTHPNSGVEDFAYDGQHRLVSYTDPDGVVTESSYGMYGEVTHAYVAGSLVEERIFDEQGRMVQSWQAGVLVASNTYTADGRPETVLGPLGVPMEVSYSADGLEVAVAAPDDTRATATVDVAGRLGSRTTPELGTAEYVYDGEGQLLSWSDDQGASMTLRYGSGGEITERTDPLGQTTIYTHDGLRRVESRTSRNGDVVEVSWDEAGRLASMTGPLLSRQFRYDPMGRPVRAEAEGVVVEWTWNEDGVATETVSATGAHPLPAIISQFSRRQTGKLSEATTAWGTTAYQYDAAGAWVSVQVDELPPVEVIRDLSGRPAQISSEAGRVQTTLTYDGQGRSLERTTHFDGEVVHQHEYAYGLGGRLSSWSDEEGTHALSYDAGGRLEVVDHPEGSALGDQVYSYDSQGWRTTWETTQLGQAVYNPMGQLLEDGWGQYSYDLQGRRTSSEAWSVDTAAGAAPWTFGWNSISQLVSATSPQGETWSCGYDALDRRVRVTGPSGTRWFIYSGELVQAVLDGDGNPLVRYVTGLSFGEVLARVVPGAPETVQYALRDRQNTPVA